MNNEFDAEPSNTGVVSPSGQTVLPEAECIQSNAGAFFYFSKKPRLDDLVLMLDRVVWVEIAVVYYMDNSFLRFVLRSLVQLVYLMPKSPGFPEPPTQPYVGGIIGTNLLCMFLHLYLSRPEAGEATRGYLHGGLLLDFIGQQGPTSKLHLFMLDSLILLLQVLALAVTIKRKDLEKLAKVSCTAPPSTRQRSSDLPTGEQVETQDHDAEERGERRRPSILLDALALEGRGDSFGEQEQRRGTTFGNRNFALSDVIASGQATIAEFYLADTVRQQHNAYQEYRTATAPSGVGESVRFNLSQRRYGLNLPFRS